MKDFDVPVTTAVWIIIAYSVGLSGASLTLARLSTFFESRRLVLVGMTVDVLVMTVIFFTHNIYIFILCRYLQGSFRQFPWLIFQIQGVGGFPPENRGKALGYSTMSSGVAMMLSLPLTGFVTDNIGWRWLFMGSAIAFTAMMPLVYTLLPKLPPNPAQQRPLSEFDFKGSGLMMLGIIGVITSVQLLTRDAGNGLLIPLLGVAGIASLAGFGACSWQPPNR
jgi:predicted MFS family arabinose efflux permease